jgi:hypothetical protein
VYIVVGSVVFVAGLWAGFDKRSFVDVTGVIKDKVLISRLNDIADATILGKVSIIIAVLGTMILILSLLGYIAAAGERRYLLNCYATILIVMTTMEAATACASVFYKNEAETTVKDALMACLKKYNPMKQRSKKDGLILMWESIMANYKCCGIYNFTDFEDKLDMPIGHPKVPESCCIKRNDANCTLNPTVLNSYKDKGCYEAVTVELVKHIDAPILIAAVLILSQVTGIILASRLSHTLLISTAKDMWGYHRREVGVLDGTFIDLRYVQHIVLIFKKMKVCLRDHLAVCMYVCLHSYVCASLAGVLLSEPYSLSCIYPTVMRNLQHPKFLRQ